MATSSVLVWFRQDLRLADNPALNAAQATGRPVVPVFVWAPEEEGSWAPGAASRWWLHQSLGDLEASLRAHRSRLLLRRGPTQEALLAVARASNAGAVFWNRRHEPAVLDRDTQMEAGLRSAGQQVETFPSGLLFEPGQVLTRQGRPFQVFTPFWKACCQMPTPPAPLPAPESLPAPTRWPTSLRLSEFGLEPAIDWAGGMRAGWRPGEAGALERLETFLGILGHYAEDRDRPDLAGTSSLSPHLHFGEISPRTVWHRVCEAAGGRDGKVSEQLPTGPLTYLKELAWREFAHHLLSHFPHTTDEPLREAFASFPWRRDPAGLRAWQRGRTGYPLVDAGMRQLWSLGWLHNRVRMVTASFLVKDLLLPWQEGARWFWDTLVDADLANNTLGWQWSAGCGADAAPYFRVFNPVTQAQKCDPNGDYVRHWLPELARLPERWLQTPWLAPAAVLQEAGVILGDTYPRPIVDHVEARARALQALALLHDL